MNRRQKIIVSVVGIFLVLLILIGLTYAYFLTKIQGNTKSKSITVKTANLALVYGDGNGVIGSETDTIKPNDEIGSKTFTVKNEGDATTGYVVVIEDVVITDLATDSTTSFQSNDFRYTLTCTTDGTIACSGVENEVFPMNGGIVVGNEIEKGKTHTYTLTMEYLETGEDQSDDMNKSLSAKIDIADIKEINPYSDKTNTLAYNIINNAKLNKNGTELKAVPDTTPAKEISGTFGGTGKYEEQELDMSTQSSWYYGDTYNDAQPWNGGSSTSSVSECSDTIVGKYISYPTVSESWLVKSCKSSTVAIVGAEIMEYEKVLTTTDDDYGKSYYYRGNVEDNYVTFAGMCWRIVRIEGDGSTKLVLEDQDETCSTTMNGNWDIATAAYGYIYDDATSTSRITYTGYTGGMADKMQDFQTNKLATYTGMLKSGDWCYDDTAYQYVSGTTLISDTSTYYTNGKDFYYGTYTRLTNKQEPSLKCSGTKLTKFNPRNETMYVGALTADEIVLAGGKVETGNENYYLINDYQKDNSKYWWSLSPSHFIDHHDDVFSVYYDGYVSYDNVSYNYISVRPAVTLSSSAVITKGDGTVENPYIVE